MKYNICKGLFDILPYSKENWKLSSIWQYLESVIRKLSIDYNYLEIRTPIFEKTELFERGVGQTSDIASKELYTFLDKAKRSISLRPENTASIMRSFIENSLFQARKLHKLFYIGPMFRYDRPQLGRYRQHHQFGVEAIGESSYVLDAEIIDMILQLFKRLEIKGIKLLLNSIGDEATRINYKKSLLDFLKPNFEKLSFDSKIRFEKNPLRILDSKEPIDQEILKTAPSILDFLTDDSKKHFENLRNLLEKLNIKYEVTDRLVRGLDYYDNTVFEIVTDDVKAQNSLGGGGRYNSFLKNLGGPDLPGIGFACGMERILQTMINQNAYFPKEKGPFIFIIFLDDKAKDFAIKLLQNFRHMNVPSDIDLNFKKIQKSLQIANNIKAQNVILIGENELNNRKVQFKNFETKEQKEICFDEINNFIQKKYLDLKR